MSIKHDSPHPPPLPSPAQPSPAQAQSINVNLFFVIAALASAGRCWLVLGPGCFRPNVVMPRSYLLCHWLPHCMGVIIFMSLLYSHKTLNLAKHAAAAVRFRSDHLNAIILAYILTNEILCSFVGKIFLFPPFPVKS